MPNEQIEEFKKIAATRLYLFGFRCDRVVADVVEKHKLESRPDTVKRIWLWGTVFELEREPCERTG